MPLLPTSASGVRLCSSSPSLIPVASLQRLKPWSHQRTHNHHQHPYLQHRHQLRVLQTSSTAAAAAAAAASDRARTTPSAARFQQLRLPSTPPHSPRRRHLSPSTMTSLTQAQARGHTGHSHHHHHHHHDNTYLTSTNKNDAGVRITRIGLYSNLGMAVAKGVGGYAFNSQSMIADAWHSLTDLASDVLTLATVAWSLKPPTAAFPAGFGKVESLGSLGVSGMLLGGGVFMCLNSCEILYAHLMYDAQHAADVAMHAHGHSHAHGAATAGPSLNAAWLAGGTVILKEWLYHATMKVAKERKSSILASNAVHHRVDSLTGIVTLFAILGANFLHEAAWLDPVGGLLISLLVIRAGWGNTVSALYELADASIDDEVKASVRRAVGKGLAGLPNKNNSGHQAELREVKGVKSGQNYLIDLEMAVPNAWTVEEVAGVEEAVRVAVGGGVRGARRVRIRFVPELAPEAANLDEFIGEDVSPRESPEPEGEENGHSHDHDHDHGHDHGRVNGSSKKMR